MNYQRRLTREFYLRPSPVVARDLIGCVLTRRLEDGTLLAARIVETEAYIGDGSDPGSHAHHGRTNRNQVMFGPAGRLYVYFTYGMHFCANVVCEETGTASAVLLRAAEPVEGIEIMRENRAAGRLIRDRDVLRGPANFCKAFGLDRAHNGATLLTGALAIRPRPRGVRRPDISITTRIGLSRGASLPYRFHATGDPHVSGSRRLNLQGVIL